MPPRFGRIGDWSNDNEHDDDSGDENDKRESWFAGGERSGISVQNPNRQADNGQFSAGGGDLVRELLRRAKEGGAAPQEQQVAGGFRVFSGGGHTLGSDEVESTFIPDPNAPVEEEEEVVTRTITLWQDGFQIEDGELFRFDDPNNASVIEDLNAGRAPLHLLNVRHGQPVELRINPRQQEPYRPSPGSQIFRGSGHRLGAPVPEPVAGASSSRSGSGATSMPGSFPTASASSSGAAVSLSGAAASSSTSEGSDRPSITTRFQVDQSKPTTSIQVRLADGTRIVCRMNLTHTVGDVRNFINASRPENVARPYTIGTTFPNRVLEDDTATIESAGLVNSVVVQRWA
ncbi:hypothetical protein NP233_g6969 [Leucocoprinus birnbaumii]|uniref:SEP-domain-containing protein n=1 Tax=Leucocoprinus birnbaumii TaxID=56174 RepID=A0AAD5YV87_9AGAR|nr:hypothetical protein NP233_g6969 [Leucocoprinus birnbaumii]